MSETRKFKTISGKLIDIANRANPFQMMILGGLQSKPLYQGRLGSGYKPETLKKRRAKNKRAHRQRMINAHK